jgi:hypothetical protein
VRGGGPPEAHRSWVNLQRRATFCDTDRLYAERGTRLTRPRAPGAATAARTARGGAANGGARRQGLWTLKRTETRRGAMLITWQSFGQRDDVGEVTVREIDTSGRR